MSATKDEIKGWIDQGIARGSTHLIVARDTYDNTNYPVFVSSDQSAEEEYHKKLGQTMTEVDEVYNLRGDLEAQLSEYRAKPFD